MISKLDYFCVMELYERALVSEVPSFLPKNLFRDLFMVPVMLLFLLFCTQGVSSVRTISN